MTNTLQIPTAPHTYIYPPRETETLSNSTGTTHLPPQNEVIQYFQHYPCVFGFHVSIFFG